MDPFQKAEAMLHQSLLDKVGIASTNSIQILKIINSPMNEHQHPSPAVLQYESPSIEQRPVVKVGIDSNQKVYQVEIITPDHKHHYFAEESGEAIKYALQLHAKQSVAAVLDRIEKAGVRADESFINLNVVNAMVEEIEAIRREYGLEEQ